MMNDARERFSFFRTYVETIEKCPERVQLALFKAVVHYGLDEEMPDFSQYGEESCYLDAIFCQQLVSLDYSHMKQEVGKNGGAPLGNKHNPYGRNGKPIINQETTKNNQEPTHDNDNDNDNDIKEERIKKNRTAFVPPSIDEVREYADNSGYAINAEAFVSYYEAVGWMVGKNKMKNWQAAVRSWASREKQQNPQPQQRKTRSVNLDDIL